MTQQQHELSEDSKGCLLRLFYLFVGLCIARACMGG